MWRNRKSFLKLKEKTSHLILTHTIVNTETDVLSLVSYESGINSYDMKLLFDSKVVNVEETVTNIIDSINSPIYYFLIDHLTNLPYCENCNTALYNTIDINTNGKF